MIPEATQGSWHVIRERGSQRGRDVDDQVSDMSTTDRKSKADQNAQGDDRRCENGRTRARKPHREAPVPAKAGFSSYFVHGVLLNSSFQDFLY